MARATRRPPVGGPSRGTKPIVVKLGGSLFETPPGGGPVAALGWLDILSRARVPVVVVPGGGAFADTVRAEQRRLGFGDPVAHRMALLAMHQMALAMVGMAPRAARMIVAPSRAAIGDALARGRMPVWTPLPMVDADSTLPENWSITSDGLAAWLAGRLGAPHVVLVKPRAVASDATAAQLAAAGVVDAEFARIVTPEACGQSIVTPEACGRSIVTPEARGQSIVTPEARGQSIVAPEARGQSIVASQARSWSIVGPGEERRLAGIVGADMQPGDARAPGRGAAKARRR